MPERNRIIEDVTNKITTGKLIYTVNKPPYFEDSVSVYVNGLLQDPTFFTELDPVAGTVSIDEPVLIRDEEDYSLHIIYSTKQEIFIDPKDPVHISQLIAGDVVRISFRPGRHLEPKLQPRSKNVILEPGGSTFGKRRSARGYSRTVVLGLITSNDSVTGTLRLQVDEKSRSRCAPPTPAVVPYATILRIQKYITPSEPDIDIATVGGGPRTQRRPGVRAFGFSDHRGRMNLVKVFF